MTEPVNESETKFLTADQLMISEVHRCGLVKTLERLQSGTFKHVYGRAKNSDIKIVGPSDDLLFNLGSWRAEYTCGTACCIGGTAEVLMGLPYGEMDRAGDENVRQGNRNLYKLFYGVGRKSGSLGDITVDQAAKALHNYLTVGRPKWEEIA